MAQANIDVLKPKKSIIDLTDAHNNSLDGLIDQDYELGFVYTPTNAVQRAWRKGKVILAGPECKYTKKNDIVIFPNNLGVGIGNADIHDHGPLKKGIFLNESRLFGIAKKKNESKSSKSKK